MIETLNITSSLLCSYIWGNGFSSNTQCWTSRLSHFNGTVMF